MFIRIWLLKVRQYKSRICILMILPKGISIFVAIIFQCFPLLIIAFCSFNQDLHYSLILFIIRSIGTWHKSLIWCPYLFSGILIYQWWNFLQIIFSFIPLIFLQTYYLHLFLKNLPMSLFLPWRLYSWLCSWSHISQNIISLLASSSSG